jgi:hypothetical protein
MENEALNTVNGQKTEHAQAVLAALAALNTLIDSEGDLWFGGLPPTFEELKRIVEHRSAAIRQTFEIAE